MLGSHGLYGKAKLYEEAIRVPLIMSFPGEIPVGRVVEEPVSHIDVFSTSKSICVDQIVAAFQVSPFALQ